MNYFRCEFSKSLNREMQKAIQIGSLQMHYANQVFGGWMHCMHLVNIFGPNGLCVFRSLFRSQMQTYTFIVRPYKYLSAEHFTQNFWEQRSIENEEDAKINCVFGARLYFQLIVSDFISFHFNFLLSFYFVHFPRPCDYIVLNEIFYFQFSVQTLKLDDKRMNARTNCKQTEKWR